jgi:hypothetical protein
MEQMDAESLEMVAGAARLLRRAAEPTWRQADAAGPRSSRQILALGIDGAAEEASGLLSRRARLEGPKPVGDNPAELLASAEQLLRRICLVGGSAQVAWTRFAKRWGELVAQTAATIPALAGASEVRAAPRPPTIRAGTSDRRTGGQS